MFILKKNLKVFILVIEMVIAIMFASALKP